jgi:hypothetical protein
MVASSAILLSLQLCLQAVQQIGVDTGIDFLLQDLLGTLDGQRGHLLTQGFTGSNGLLLSFSAGSSNNLVAFFCRAGLGFFDDGLGAAFGVRKPRSCSLRVWANSCSTRLLAAVSSVLALSAAARPSAIFWARSSSAFAIGGHTNFIVNSTRSGKHHAERTGSR